MDISNLISGFLGSLVGAIIGWLGTLHAATKVQKLERANLADATRLALKTEIEGLAAAIEGNLGAQLAASGYVFPFFGSDPSRLCPIYMASAGAIGHLSPAAQQAVVRFYTGLTTLKLELHPTGGGEIRHLVGLADLRQLESAADVAIIQLR